MKNSWKVGVACFLSLLLVAVFLLGCGGGGGGEKGVTITIGELTDFTGSAAPAVKSIHYVIEDIAKYYNDENLIPGVKVKIAAYDTRLDPARDLPGYDWCKEHGAKVVITMFPQNADALKAFAERDKVVIAAMNGSTATFEPPGWVFCSTTLTAWGMKTMLQWIHENDWKGQGIPKLGLVAWDEPGGVSTENAVKEYVDDHPGEFDYVGGYLTPLGTTTFRGQAQKLKNCDYIATYSLPGAYALRDLRAIGGKGKLIDPMAITGFKRFFADLLGWDTLDGTLAGATCLTWNDSSPIVDLAKKLLHQYRSSEANEMIDVGPGGYVGPAFAVIAIFEILQQAIQNVGVENFDGQAYFDAAINYKTTSSMWAGCPQWSFSQTKRYLVDHVDIFEFSAEAQDLVRITDWLPLIKE